MNQGVNPDPGFYPAYSGATIKVFGVARERAREVIASTTGMPKPFLRHAWHLIPQKDSFCYRTGIVDVEIDCIAFIRINCSPSS
jgi:hypothetical protein